MFNETDLKQFEKQGIDPQTAKKQVELFKTGFPFSDITEAATVKKGIKIIDNEDIKNLCSFFDSQKNNYKIVKFVPASGAATRMFKDLFEFIQETNSDLNNPKFSSVNQFVKNIEKFAFYGDLKKITDRKNIDIKNNPKQTIEFLLNEIGLNYGNLPKALLKFHKYETFEASPAYEQIIEAEQYTNQNKNIEIHFTISPEHRADFEKHILQITENQKIKSGYEITVKISEQKKSTDTIAVTPENTPFRNKDGKILFRPAGHGALIQNLNEINADIIFIKNIDNVVPQKNSQPTYTYKKALGAILIKTVQDIHFHLNNLQNNFSPEILDNAEKFLKNVFFIEINNSDKCKAERKYFAETKLNRPIRICGMVKNEGEPGGGPFFVKNRNNGISLQIVENSQIDPNSEQKQKILKSSTHFNPVDLVLYVKDFEGNKFDLTNYSDPETGFISYKSKDGKEIKAMELPGLWNGAMAEWNTIFVEVPVSTFNPVKTVNDLLKIMHQ